MSRPKAVLYFTTETQAVTIRVFGNFAKIENSMQHQEVNTEYWLKDDRLWKFIIDMIQSA